MAVYGNSAASAKNYNDSFWLSPKGALDNFFVLALLQKLTFKISPSSFALLHSPSLNSYFLKSILRSLVTASITGRYSMAKFNMSNVEFHLVATSRGIILLSIFKFFKISCHRGKIMVEEWSMAYANRLTCFFW